MKKFILFLFVFSLYGHDHQFQKRYAVIKKYLNNYSRPFTAIEVNASAQKPFSLLISQDFKSTCLIFGSKNYRACAERAQKNKQNNLLIATQKNMHYYLKRLAECEHFDVVIMPYLPMSDLSSNAIELCSALGDHMIIELVSSDDLPETIHIKDKTLLKLESVEYGTQKSTFYLIYNPRTDLYRRYWTAQPSTKRFYALHAAFDEKSYRKRESRETPIPWMHGINLMTFSKLQGIYPAPETIIECIKRFSKVKHGDLAINNIIIQGRDLQLIDWQSKKIDAPAEALVAGIIDDYLRNLAG